MNQSWKRVIRLLRPLTDASLSTESSCPAALTVYSTLLCRLGRCEEKGLRRLQREIGEMNRLWNSEARQAFSGDALEELMDAVDWINRHSG